MTVRLFALAATVAAGLALASSASAQDPRGPRATGFSVGGGFFNDSRPDCRRRAFECGVRAYDYFGPARGVVWFRHAARRGSAPAMRSLGFIYLRGARGVAANPAEAMGWFYEAALRDDAQSMYALGRAFEEGVGVAPDPVLARFWLERAAEKGDAQARRTLRGR